MYGSFLNDDKNTKVEQLRLRWPLLIIVVFLAFHVLTTRLRRSCWETKVTIMTIQLNTRPKYIGFFLYWDGNFGLDPVEYLTSGICSFIYGSMTGKELYLRLPGDIIQYLQLQDKDVAVTSLVVGQYCIATNYFNSITTWEPWLISCLSIISK